MTGDFSIRIGEQMLCDGLFAVILTNAIPQEINNYVASLMLAVTLQGCFKLHSSKRFDERESDI